MFLPSFLPGFRCSGQKHCRYDAAIDHPGAGIWLPGGISLKYACIPGEGDFKESFAGNLRPISISRPAAGQRSRLLLDRDVDRGIGGTRGTFPFERIADRRKGW